MVSLLSTELIEENIVGLLRQRYVCKTATKAASRIATQRCSKNFKSDGMNCSMVIISEFLTNQGPVPRRISAVSSKNLSSSKL